jgi:hypothetical protein
MQRIGDVRKLSSPDIPRVQKAVGGFKGGWRPVLCEQKEETDWLATTKACKHSEVQLVNQNSGEFDCVLSISWPKPRWIDSEEKLWMRKQAGPRQDMLWNNHSKHPR